MAVGLGTTACAVDLMDEKPDVSLKKGGNGGKEDAYSRYNDNPATFANDLEHKLDALPRNGAATVAPWAGNYWPTYQDNINKKWDGASSKAPSTKYGEAFGVTGVEDAVSRNYGIDSRTSAKTCKQTSECDSSKGEACAIRDGKTEGRCVPTWFGICHAWAPVSTMIAEPKFPVVHNGVTFKVQDIKALLTLSWNRTTSKFVSSRCNKNANDLNHDAYGNYRDDPECENTNPGTWHIIATNYLGIRGESFVYDRTWDDEVWNQPLRNYEVTKQDEITAQEANKLSGVTTTGGTTANVPATNVKKDAWFHHPPMTVAEGQTVMVTMKKKTGDTGDADLYVRFDGQPTASQHDCRPYANGSDEECGLVAPAGATQMFVSVNGYSEANFTLTMTVGGSIPTTYVHNSKADKLYHVKMKVGYISESSASTDGNLADRIDQYTHYDNYEYILEVDKDGKIDGGVWLGNSKTTHPDFLWLATGPRDASVASGKIKRSEVMMLVEKSYIDPNGTTPPPGGGADKVVEKSGSVAKDKWVHYGPFNAKDGIKVEMTGTADADVYVRRNAAPTRTAHDCRPYLSNSNESCTVTGGGEYYVSVNGWATTSNFDLVITYTEGNGATEPTEPTPTVVHIDQTSDIRQDGMKRFSLDVIEGQRIFVRTFVSEANVSAGVDLDIYIQMNGEPTTSAYLERGYTTANPEVIEYTPTTSGKLHILVHGYTAQSEEDQPATPFTLRTSAI